jgi:TonB family protein
MSRTEVYSPREIARAAGVTEERVRAVLGTADGFVPYSDALRLARNLRAASDSPVEATQPAPGGSSDVRPALFTIFGPNGRKPRAQSVPLAVSGTLHLGIVVLVVLVTSLGLAPTAKTLAITEERPADMHLVFLNIPGPGGGGGGGGALQKPPPPKAERKGRSTLSSPMPPRQRPIAVEPPPKPPEPEPPPMLKSEPMPVVSAPIVQAPAEDRDRAGLLQQARAEAQSRGPGTGGGVGSGTGTGIGEGSGNGVGPGSGGGTGGGPYRPGSGIEPPRLLKEVRADYTDDGRRRTIEGEVVLEIIVRNDGSVGDVKILKRLGAGLDERAVQAVKQWRFAPARRLGSPVDVVVEVAVEFKLR